MSWFSRRICFLAGGLGLALAGSASFGATYSMKAVKINGTPLASPQSTINAMSGDRIEAEVFLRGWNEDEPGGKLTVFQFAIDGLNSFFKSEVDDLNVALPGCFDLGPVIKCASNADCPVATPSCGTNMVCIRPCASDDDCGGDLPVCEVLGGFCAGVNNDPNACTFGDKSRDDWPLDHVSVVAACSFQGVDIACGAVTLGAQGVDNGQTAYVGTVTIDLTAAACGTIVPALVTTEEGGSFITLASGFTFVPATENLTINVTDNPTCMGCSTLVSSTPPDCSVDARIPHAVDSTNPSFWFNDGFDFELEFNNIPEGGFMQSDFSLSVVPPQPILPSIDAFSVDGSGKIVSFSVNRPPSLTPPRWLCINFDDPNPSCPNQPRCWARLPGDVNGDNSTSANDLTALIVGLGDLDVNRCDMDRSGACNAPDLLMWIDLANGVGRLTSPLGKTLDPCPTIP